MASNDSGKLAIERTMFALLLRRRRIAVGLSQEQLAERAMISAKAVGALERGARRFPYRSTVGALAEALTLEGDALIEFRAAANRIRDAPPTLNEPARHNMPPAATSFVGRRQELDEVVSSFDSNRLVTITGAGGTGKTRLAITAALRLADRLENGAWLVELASVTDLSGMLSMIAGVLDLELNESEPLDALAKRLRSRDTLLVLDNCEHLVPYVADMTSRILRTCPRLHILATSRERLSVSAEVIYRLNPHVFPHPDEMVDASNAREFPAIDLFMQRAGSAEGTISFSDVDARAIGEICRSLDGIALAIEIAAARCYDLGLAGILEKVRRHPSELASGFRDVPKRHVTLAAAIEWSYDLLSDREQRVFRTLSIFVDGCSSEAVRSVTAESDIELETAEDVVLSLVDKSLVVLEHHRFGARYRLLESTRTYAFDRLRAHAEDVGAAHRHAVWAASLADRELQIEIAYGMDDRRRRVRLEFGNLTTAFGRVLDSKDGPVIAGRILAVLRIYFNAISRRRLGVPLADMVLRRIDENEQPCVTARVLSVRSDGLFGRERAMVLDRVIALFTRTRSAADLRGAYLALAYTLIQLGERQRATTALQWAWTYTIASGRERSYGAIDILILRAWILQLDDAHERARALYEEALVLSKRFDIQNRTSIVVMKIAEIDLFEGRVESARSIFERCIDSLDEFHRNETFINHRLAACHILRGDLHAAAEAIRRAIAADEDAVIENLKTLERGAHVAALSGRYAEAEIILAYVDKHFNGAGFERDALDRALATKLRALLLTHRYVVIGDEKVSARAPTAESDPTPLLLDILNEL